MIVVRVVKSGYNDFESPLFRLKGCDVAYDPALLPIDNNVSQFFVTNPGKDLVSTIFYAPKEIRIVNNKDLYFAVGIDRCRAGQVQSVVDINANPQGFLQPRNFFGLGVVDVGVHEYDLSDAQVGDIYTITLVSGAINAPYQYKAIQAVVGLKNFEAVFASALTAVLPELDKDAGTVAADLISQGQIGSELANQNWSGAASELIQTLLGNPSILWTACETVGVHIAPDLAVKASLWIDLALILPQFFDAFLDSVPPVDTLVIECSGSQSSTVETEAFLLGSEDSWSFWIPFPPSEGQIIFVQVTNVGVSPLSNVWVGFDVRDPLNRKVENTKTPIADSETGLVGAWDFVAEDPLGNIHEQGVTINPGETWQFQTRDPYLFDISVSGHRYRGGRYSYAYAVWENGYPGQQGAKRIGNIRNGTITIRDSVPPQAPNGLVSSRSGDSIGLAWEKVGKDTNQDDLFDMDFFEVFRSDSQTGPYVKIGDTDVDDLQSVPCSFIDNATDPSQKYYYEVRAIDTGGNISAFSEPLCVAYSIPVAHITSIIPNPAVQEQGNINFTGAGDDPDDQGTRLEICNYKWSADNVIIYEGPDPSFSISASDFIVGTHKINLCVQDNDGPNNTPGDWSDTAVAYLTVLPPQTGQADYRVNQLSMIGETTGLQGGDPLTLTINTANIGSGPGGGNSVTRVYLTTQQSGDPRASGVAVATMSVGNLSGGASQSLSFGALFPSVAPGTYYLAACADADNQISESNKGNNWLYNPTPVQFKGGPFSASGRVTDDGGNGMDGIRITLVKTDTNGNTLDTRVFFTNGEGNWSATDILGVGESWTVTPGGAGYSMVFNPAFYQLGPVDRTRADLNFVEAIVGYTMSGRVTRPDGSPYGKGTIRSQWTVDQIQLYLPVDAHGYFSRTVFTNNLSSGVDFYFEPVDNVLYEWPSWTPGNHYVFPIANSSDLDFHVAFSNSSAISGIVQDKQGTALGSIGITCRCTGTGPADYGSDTVLTNADGTFKFEDVIKGKPYKIYPDQAGMLFAPAEYDIASLNTDVSDIAFVTADRPVANFDATPISGSLPLTVKFTDTSTSGDLPITDWLWDFGDGVTTTTQNPIHDYPTTGTFTVKLTITSAGGSSTQEAPGLITAHENVAPDQPTNIYPICLQSHVSCESMLVGSAFVDPDGNDTQSKGEFQVANLDGDFDHPVWDSVEISNGNTYTSIPSSAGLQQGQYYRWRCRYQDNKGAWSAWSNETVFKTSAARTGASEWMLYE